MMVYEPENSPAAPTPHIARPMIKAVEFGAAPQITLPSSKKKMEVRYVHFKGKNVYSRPQCAVVAAVVMKKDEPYQPMSWRLLNSSVILGMAVEMIVCAFG
jgi:hypothetical protein